MANDPETPHDETHPPAEGGAQQGNMFADGPGGQLRAAREDAGMSIDQLSRKTRITQRHLEAVEAGDWEALPSRTYAIGFSRTYARTMGLDEKAIIEQVRAELAQRGDDQQEKTATFEPGDPARIPGRGLAWFSAFATVLLAAGLFAFYGDRVFPGAGPASILPSSEPAPTAEAAPEEVRAKPAGPNADSEVVFTAIDDGVWVRFTDEGERLYEKLMTKGERFVIPRDAVDPRLNTGRPDLLAITIGGQSAAKLAEEPVTLGDAQVGAAALLARDAATPAE